jgi:hypothetical protein
MKPTTTLVRFVLVAISVAACSALPEQPRIDGGTGAGGAAGSVTGGAGRGGGGGAVAGGGGSGGGGGSPAGTAGAGGVTGIGGTAGVTGVAGAGGASGAAGTTGAAGGAGRGGATGTAGAAGTTGAAGGAAGRGGSTGVAGAAGMTGAAGTGGAAGSGGSGHGIFRLSSATYSVTEGATVTITMQRINGSTGNVSVAYFITSGTAMVTSDYSVASTSGQIAWTAGDTANKTLTIMTVNDTDDEPDETFTVSLYSPNGGASVGDPDDAIVTITDNDTP